MTKPAAAESPTRVVVVDDHTLFREGVASLLARADDITLVGEAATGEEALRVVADLLPDIVLMDIKMPGIGGIEATRAIVARSPHIGVIMLTMFEDDESVFAALKAGARGYVLKDADRGTLACDPGGRAWRGAAWAIDRPAGARSVYQPGLTHHSCAGGAGLPAGAALPGIAGYAG